MNNSILDVDNSGIIDVDYCNECTSFTTFNDVKKYLKLDTIMVDDDIHKFESIDDVINFMKRNRQDIKINIRNSETISIYYFDGSVDNISRNKYVDLIPIINEAFINKDVKAYVIKHKFIYDNTIDELIRDHYTRSVSDIPFIKLISHLINGNEYNIGEYTIRYNDDGNKLIHSEERIFKSINRELGNRIWNMSYYDLRYIISLKLDRRCYRHGEAEYNDTINKLSHDFGFAKE